MLANRWRIKKLALSQCTQKKKNLKEKVKVVEEPPKIYEDEEVANKIPVRYISIVSGSIAKNNLIYESYKPQSLNAIIGYMDFCLTFRSILPNTLRSYSCSKDGIDDNKEAMCEDLGVKFDNVAKELKEYYNSEIQTNFPQEVDQTKILIFDSNFECGNLDKVTIVSLDEYNLYLNPDTNTKGYSQWFYFAVGNTFENRKVIFHILNCTNPASLLKKGMKPLVFSEQEYKQKGTPWTADTTNVTYNPNDLSKRLTGDSITNQNCNKTYYTLTFSYTFKHNNDRVYFAYTRPYTVSMCFELLRSVKSQLKNKAEQVKVLEENGLQKRIKKFHTDAVEAEQKKQEQKKAQVKKAKVQSKPVIKEKTETIITTYNLKYKWMKSEEIQIEAKGILYKQETLCRTFSGIPIILLTITKYILHTFR